ncbi:MAG: protein kinase [Myxococcota bacterium]
MRPMTVSSQPSNASTPSPLNPGGRLSDHWTIGARWAIFGDVHLHAGTSEIEVDIASWRYQGSQPLPKFLDALDADRQRFTALVHPQVCRTFDIGRVPNELTCYWVQEAPGGVPLLKHLHERSVVVPDLTINLGLQIAFGLDALHRAGLVHGDLDPELVRIVGKDRVKLSWAGLATRIESAGLDAGRGGARSVAEVPPETLHTGTANVASDIYGFAALLYRMLAGTSPYLVRKNNPPPVFDPSEAMERLPAAVPPVLLSPLTASLGHDPAKRPTIEEWIEALRHAERQLAPSLGQWSAEAAPRRDAAATAPSAPTRTSSASTSPRPGAALRIDSTIGNLPRSGRTAKSTVPRASDDGKPATPSGIGSRGTVRPRMVQSAPTPTSVSSMPPRTRSTSGASLPSLLAATSLMALVVLGGVAILGSLSTPPPAPVEPIMAPSTPARFPAIVTLSTYPPGATVFENDAEIGTTPMEVVLPLEPYAEPRKFQLVLDGHATHTVRQPWTDDAKQHDVALQPLDGPVRQPAFTPAYRVVAPPPTYPLPTEAEAAPHVDPEAVPDPRGTR